MSQPADTPLFPLGVVLFPTQPLPLRIFEERYKLMISECLEQGAGFGVVLIKEGREVGGPAAPFEIGTMAKIVEAQRFPDGRYNLNTVGDTPFRLLRVTQVSPYMRGEIEPIEHVSESGEGMATLMETVRRRFEAHVEVLKGIYGGSPHPWTSPPTTPSDSPTSWPTSSPCVCRRSRSSWKSPAPSNA